MREKQDFWAWIDANREEIIRRGRAFFACAELGFREWETMRKICERLDAWGLPYEKEIALTGVKVTIGTGTGYHIGVIADMDALPRRNAPGCIHSCGHSIQASAALTVLEALVQTDFLQETDGRVTFFFTPAEEFIDFVYRDGLIREGKLEFRSGKQNMIALGCFDGVDCILSLHANGEKKALFDIDSTLTGFVSKKAIFLGKAAHSGAAPYLGRNTLHGAMLCIQALTFLKEQFAPEAGLQLAPVLTEPGGDLNSVPAQTVLETYIRANDAQTLSLAEQRFDDCVRHCAQALGLGWRLETKAGYLPLQQSALLCRTVQENMLAFCREKDIVRHPVSGASGDVGDLGSLLPTVQFGFAGIEGSFHSDAFAVRDEELCYLTTAKVLCGAIYDLLTHPEKRAYGKNFPEKKERYLAYLRQRQ